jgi:hypothetical protein
MSGSGGATYAAGGCAGADDSDHVGAPVVTGAAGAGVRGAMLGMVPSWVFLSSDTGP